VSRDWTAGQVWIAIHRPSFYISFDPNILLGTLHLHYSTGSQDPPDGRL